MDINNEHLRIYFATHNTTDPATGGSPSTQPIEFATLDLIKTYSAGQIVEIIPLQNLQLRIGNDSDNWLQGFGVGHVVLSNLWDGTDTEIINFFEEFESITQTPADTIFPRSSTRLSSFGISRIPKNIPTSGQSQALLGSTSRLNPPLYPNTDNKFVTELDQGTGLLIDLEAQPGIISNANIDRYGHTGALTHRIVKLVIDAQDLGTQPSFYDNHVLPRLRILFGRNPQFGDGWYNGTRFMWFNGDSWQG